tara:strand:- start:42472 stop:42876 length:405 start_codon:yes stop_codon:yes gene_type:complete
LVKILRSIMKLFTIIVERIDSSFEPKKDIIMGDRDVMYFGTFTSYKKALKGFRQVYRHVLKYHEISPLKVTKKFKDLFEQDTLCWNKITPKFYTSKAALSGDWDRKDVNEYYFRFTINKLDHYIDDNGQLKIVK